MKHKHAVLLSLLLVASVAQGCSEDDTSEDAIATSDATTPSTTTSDEGSTSSSSSSPSSSGMSESSTSGLDIDALYDCVDPDFTVFVPLAGPGYDAQTGFTEPLADEYIVHTTQILVKEDQISEFSSISEQVSEQLQQTPGLVAVGIAGEPNCGFQRTLGIWRSEAEMYAFVASGAHAVAMSRTLSLSVTGKVTSWTATPEGGPISWEQAIEQLASIAPSPIYD